MDRYIVGEVIGGGINGDVRIVYRRGEDDGDSGGDKSRKYVLKKMSLMYGSHPFIYGLNQVSIMSSLSHPNIGRIEEVFIEDGIIHIIMPYYGRDLTQVTLSHEDIRMVMWKMVNTLLYLDKRRVIHRDIKPMNILVDDDRKEPTLIDFDIASIDGTDLDNSDVVTLLWRHPSLIDGMVDYDIRVDIWALGVTMYNMITGDLLWTAEYPYEYRDKVIESLTSGSFLSTLDKKGIHGDERDFLIQVLQPRYEDIPMFEDLISSPYFQGLSYPVFKGPCMVAIETIDQCMMDNDEGMSRLVKKIIYETSRYYCSGDGHGGDSIDVAKQSLLLLYRVNEKVKRGDNTMSHRIIPDIRCGANIPRGHIVPMAIACVEIICTGYKQLYIDDTIVVMDPSIIARYILFVCDILKCSVHPFVYNTDR